MDDTFKPPEHIPEHFVNCNRWRMKKTGAAKQHLEQAQTDRTGKIQKKPTFTDYSNAEGEILINCNGLGRRQEGTSKIDERNGIFEIIC